MTKGTEKSLVIWSFWMPFKRSLETISGPYEHSKWGGGRGRGGTIYPRVKCPPLNPHVCFHFNEMIEGIEKSLVIWSFQNALQEDTGNGSSYLIPMNIVNEGGGGQGGEQSTPG